MSFHITGSGGKRADCGVGWGDRVQVPWSKCKARSPGPGGSLDNVLCLQTCHGFISIKGSMAVSFGGQLPVVRK